jgi:hypothetical protein
LANGIAKAKSVTPYSRHKFNILKPLKLSLLTRHTTFANRHSWKKLPAFTTAGTRSTNLALAMHATCKKG